MTVIKFSIEGDKETRAALERLAAESPARARRAMNRTVGVVRQRVIKTVSRLVGIPQRVLGGRQGRKGRRGKGYFKQVRATRTRATAAIIGLVEGIRFSNIGRKSLGRSRRKPGGIGQPFRARMPSGHDSLFERVSPQVRVSKRATAGTSRPNLPVREVVIPIWQHAVRAMRTHMLRAARTVYPAKVWEELKKSIKPVRG